MRSLAPLLLLQLTAASVPVVSGQSPAPQVPRLSQVPRLQENVRATLSIDTLVAARARSVTVRPIDRSDRQALAATFLRRLGDRALTESTATEISLAVLYEANLLADRSQEEIDAARLDLYLAAAQQRQREANQGSEMRMMELQSLTQQRSQLITLSTNLIRALTDAQSRILGE